MRHREIQSGVPHDIVDPKAVGRLPHERGRMLALEGPGGFVNAASSAAIEITSTSLPSG